MAKKSKAEKATVTVGSINVPGYSRQVDAAKYAAAKKALLKVLPKKTPGLTQMEMIRAVAAELPKADFPGSTAGWWTKCVQLDLEAKGLVVRNKKAKPLQWTRAK